MFANVLAEQRSARLPVTQEIVGSNPIGDAERDESGESSVESQSRRRSRWCFALDSSLSTLDQFGAVRKRKSGEVQTFVIVCGFDSHPCY